MNAIPLSSVEVRTSKYQFSHGYLPRGKGRWAFLIAGAVTFIPGNLTFAQAKASAKTIAAAKGCAKIEVAP